MPELALHKMYVRCFLLFHNFVVIFFFLSNCLFLAGCFYMHFHLFIHLSAICVTSRTKVFCYAALIELCKFKALHANTCEPVHEKTNSLGFRPGPTQARLYSHRRQQEALNFEFKKKRYCTICVAKTKALINFPVSWSHLCFRLCKLLVFSCSGSCIFQ